MVYSWSTNGLIAVYLLSTSGLVVPQTTTDCHRLPLTGLNASVYTGLNAQKLGGIGMDGPLNAPLLRAPTVLMTNKDLQEGKIMNE